MNTNPCKVLAALLSAFLLTLTGCTSRTGRVQPYYAEDSYTVMLSVTGNATATITFGIGSQIEQRYEYPLPWEALVPVAKASTPVIINLIANSQATDGSQVVCSIIVDGETIVTVPSNEPITAHTQCRLELPYVKAS